MDVHEALYTTRMMRRVHPDPIPLDAQARILDAAIRAPNGGNTQRWHFLAVDDQDTKTELAAVYRRCRAQEYADIAAGKLAKPVHDPEAHAETMRRIKTSGDYSDTPADGGEWPRTVAPCTRSAAATAGGRTSASPSLPHSGPANRLADDRCPEEGRTHDRSGPACRPGRGRRVHLARRPVTRPAGVGRPGTPHP